MNKISQAIIFATKAFDGKFRKSEHLPSIFHSLEASIISQSVLLDEDVACAAILHDTIEDAGITLQQIEDQFGKRIAYLVSTETEDRIPGSNPIETWKARKQKSLDFLKQTDDIAVKALWLGDKLSNMRSFHRTKKEEGSSMWNKFNQKDPNEHKKYYQTIAEELKIFEDKDAYIEYCSLIEKVFN